MSRAKEWLRKSPFKCFLQKSETQNIRRYTMRNNISRAKQWLLNGPEQKYLKYPTLKRQYDMLQTVV